MQIDLKGWGVGYVSSFQQHCLLQMLNSVAGEILLEMAHFSLYQLCCVCLVHCVTGYSFLSILSFARFSGLLFDCIPVVLLYNLQKNCVMKCTVESISVYAESNRNNKEVFNLSRSCLLNICARVVQNRPNDLTFIRSYDRTRHGTDLKMNLKLCKNPRGYKTDFEPTQNT